MSSQEEQIQQRRANLEELAKLGVEIYPRTLRREAHRCRSGRRPTASDTHDELEAERPETITSRAHSGRFDPSARRTSSSSPTAARRIQVYIRQDALPPLDFQIFKLLDFGDWVGVEGRLFRTKTNELTIWASRLHFLSKCLLPLPEKWHGLTDVEIRYRQRYSI